MDDFFYFSVCPSYRYQRVPSRKDLKQDIMLQLELNRNKGAWGVNDNKMIRPTYQNVTFSSKSIETLHSFSLSFDLISDKHLEKNITNNGVTLWSKYMKENEYFHMNERYDVIVDFVYHGDIDVIEEKCLGENKRMLYPNILTNYWACLNSTTLGDQELINWKQVCDGVHDCDDKSDEVPTLCNANHFEVELMTGCFFLSYVILGLFVFLLMPKKKTEEATRTFPKSNNVKDFIKTVVTNYLEAKNGEFVGHLTDLNQRQVNGIIHFYLACHSDEERKSMFQALLVLSCNNEGKEFVFGIVEKLIQVEIEANKMKKEDRPTFNFCKDSNFYIWMFIKETVTRNNWFQRSRRRITQHLSFHCKFLGVGIYIIDNIITCLLLPLWSLLLFFYDNWKDIIVLYALRYMDITLLRDDDLRNKFDSVGGINFQLLEVYLGLLFSISQVTILYWIWKSIDVLRCQIFDINTNSKWFKAFLYGFPIHFVFLQKRYANLQISNLKRKAENVLNFSGQPDVHLVTKELMDISDEIEHYQNRVYELNKIECEMQILETSLEREPQLIVQICFYILMRRFKRIELLFTSFLADRLDLVFIFTSVLSFNAIVNSVHNYIHTRKWPVIPTIPQRMVQSIAIGLMSISKVLIISVMILNASYLYPFIYCTTMICYHLYKIAVSSHHLSVMDYIMIGITPVEFKTRAKNVKNNKFLTSLSKSLQKFGTIPNSIILHMITLLVYSIIGVILRKTMFHYNIKETYYEEMNNSEIGNNTYYTERGNLYSEENVSSIQERFFGTLHNFPMAYVIGYLICTILFAAFTKLFNRVYCPWKIEECHDEKLQKFLDNYFRYLNSPRFNQDKNDEPASGARKRRRIVINACNINLLTQSSGSHDSNSISGSTNSSNVTTETYDKDFNSDDNEDSKFNSRKRKRNMMETCNKIHSSHESASSESSSINDSIDNSNAEIEIHNDPVSSDSNEDPKFNARKSRRNIVKISTKNISSQDSPANNSNTSIDNSDAGTETCSF